MHYHTQACNTRSKTIKNQEITHTSNDIAIKLVMIRKGHYGLLLSVFTTTKW